MMLVAGTVNGITITLMLSPLAAEHWCAVLKRGMYVTPWNLLFDVVEPLHLKNGTELTEALVVRRLGELEHQYGLGLVR